MNLPHYKVTLAFPGPGRYCLKSTHFLASCKWPTQMGGSEMLSPSFLFLSPLSISSSRSISKRNPKVNTYVVRVLEFTKFSRKNKYLGMKMKGYGMWESTPISPWLFSPLGCDRLGTWMESRKKKPVTYMVCFNEARGIGRVRGTHQATAIQLAGERSTLRSDIKPGNLRANSLIWKENDKKLSSSSRLL